MSYAEHGVGYCKRCGQYGWFGEPCIECNALLTGENFEVPSELELEEERVRDTADRDGDSFSEDRL